MVKKVAKPDSKKAAKSDGLERKSDLLREWFQVNDLNGRKWNDVKDDIKSYLENHDHKFNEDSDSQTFTRIGVEKDN